MEDKIIKTRIRNIRRQLNKENISAFLVTRPANVTYSTGFFGNDSWALITGSTVYLLTDSRYTEQAQNQCPYCKIIERTAPITEAAADLLKKLSSVRVVAIENSTTLAAFEALKKNLDIRLRIVSDIIEPFRSCKDTGEVRAIAAAAKIAIQSLRKTIRYMKPGITENELAGRLDFLIRKHGAINSFETIVAFGPNASRPHHQPGARKLKENDTVLIDFGAKYKGYCCDLTRCFAIGKSTNLYKKIYMAVQEAQAAAIKMVRDGAEKTKVDAVARDIIKEYGLPVYGHGTGHGLGLEVHEEPVLSPNSKGRLKAGQIITIEPGVYIPGKLGVRIEDDVLVTGTGCRILTGNYPH